MTSNLPEPTLPPTNFPIFTNPHTQHYQHQFPSTDPPPTEGLRPNPSHGHTLQALPLNSIRLYYQNINGIKLQNDAADLYHTLESLKETQVSIACLSECNIDTNNPKVNQILHKATRKIYNSSRIQSSTSPIPFTSFYKPGGTTTIITGDTTGRVISTESDNLGRWSSQKLVCHGGKFINIITAYQVTQSNINQAGPFTAFAQQWATLTTEDNTDDNPAPRTSFYKDLTNYITLLQGKNEHIILAGDFNDTNTPGTLFFEFLTQSKLVDVITHTHGPTQHPTYDRGSRCIDFILLSESVLPYVQSCGIEPFNQTLRSDHSGIFLDLIESGLFGPPSPIPPPAHRDINSKTAKDTPKYISALKKYCIDHKIFERMAKLENDPTYHPEQIEALDRDITRGMLFAGRTCHHGRHTPWSPKLRDSQIRLRILRTTLASYQKNIDLQPQVSRLQDTLHWPMTIPTTIDEVKQSIKTQTENVKATIKDAKRYRSDYLIERARTLALKGEKDQSQALKHLIRAEEIKKMYAKLRSIRSTYQPGITRLQVPLNPNEDPKKATLWRTVNAPAEVVSYLQQRNQSHFGQAKHTPFATLPLQQSLNFQASTFTSDLMLEGTYTNNELSDITQLLITHIKSESHELPANITFTDMLNKYINWDERTSTSPSGRHLGHYHCLLSAYDPNPPNREETDLSKDASQILHLHHSMLQYSTTHGHSFDRWKTIVNVMIEKDPGNPKIHRLRVIHLYECDYNLLLAVKWRQLVHHAEDNHKLNWGQYGSRPGRTAHDPVFIEELQYEIVRLSRSTHLKFSNDATSCYDRIIPALAALLSRKYGIHKTICAILGTTLEEAKYKLKTMLGVTDSFYQHCELFPIYGTGQGSGNSPTIWLVISSTLFDAFETKAHGASYSSPDGTTRIDLFMIGFVDDSAGQTHQTSPPLAPNKLAAQMIHDAQLWGDLLYASGGDLELSKCAYHLVEHKFKSDGTPVMEPGLIGPRLTLQSGDRKSVITIKQLKVDESYKTLGCHKEPLGTQLTQYTTLKKKSDDYALTVINSPLTRSEAWTFYHTIYSPSVGYPLPVCYFSKRKLKKIQQGAIRAIIQKVGFPANCKRAIMYGPLLYGGRSLRTLHTEQFIGQFNLFLKHWRTNSQASFMLKIAVSWLQMSSGMSRSVFDDVHTPLPHLESKWLLVLRSNLASINASFQLDNTYVIPPQRENDIHIMDMVINSDRFSPTQIRRINYCRLLLKVTLLSDITDIKGSQLIPGTPHGLPQWISTPVHHYPYQHTPDMKTWRLWKQACNVWTTDGSNLLLPLGRWLFPPSQQARRWPAYMVPSGQLYIQDPTTKSYNSHYPSQDRETRGHRSFTYLSNHTHNIIPDTAQPTYPVDKLRHWRAPQTMGPIPKPLPCISPTFHHYVQSLPYWASMLISNCTFDQDELRLATLLNTQSLLIASDGGAIPGIGSFGWRAATVTGLRLIGCNGQAPGDNPESFRAEGYGLLSVLLFFHHFYRFYHIHDPLPFILYCDNEALIKTLIESMTYKYVTPNSTLSSDWDVLEEIRHHLSIVPSKLEWIKGHQDDHKPYHKLSLPAKLNVDADALATIFLAQARPMPQVPQLPHSPAYLQINSSTITKQYKQKIRFLMHGEDLLTYMKETWSWSDATAANIDWKGHSHALTAHLFTQTTLTKLIHNMLPTCKILHQRKQYHTDQCPSCQLHSETNMHLFQCRHPDRSTWRTLFLTGLKDHLISSNTKPGLITVLVQTFTKLINNQEPTHLDYPNMYTPLFRLQSAIGWHQLFRGRFSIAWVTHQAQYLKLLNPAKHQQLSQHWLTLLISFIWCRFHDVWKIRNAAHHGIDEAACQLIRRDQVNRDLTILYELQPQVLHAHRQIFRSSLDEHLKDTERNIQQWINIYKPVIHHSIKRAARLQRNSTVPINQLFPLAPRIIPAHHLPRRPPPPGNLTQTQISTIDNPNPDTTLLDQSLRSRVRLRLTIPPSSSPNHTETLSQMTQTQIATVTNPNPDPNLLTAQSQSQSRRRLNPANKHKQNRSILSGMKSIKSFFSSK
jgi:exonuclease III